MTTNKSEVVAWLHSVRQESEVITDKVRHVWGTPRGSMASYSVPLIRLSDYEALQAECEKLRKDAEPYRSLLEAVLREIPHRKWRRGNAPGHAHSVQGIWDEDNGALAGKECAWCKLWNEAVSAMEPPK